MTSETAFVFTIIGTVFNFVGFVISLGVIIKVQRDYGQTPVYPWLSKMLIKGRGYLRRIKIFGKKNATIYPESTYSTTTFDTSLQIVARNKFNERLKEGERIKRLEDEMLNIYKELDYKNKDMKKKDSALRGKVSSLESQVNVECNRLEVLTKKAVTGDVRLQLIGVMFIGTGTILVAIPTLFSLVIEVWL